MVGAVSMLVLGMRDTGTPRSAKSDRGQSGVDKPAGYDGRIDRTEKQLTSAQLQKRLRCGLVGRFESDANRVEPQCANPVP